MLLSLALFKTRFERPQDGIFVRTTQSIPDLQFPLLSLVIIFGDRNKRVCTVSDFVKMVHCRSCLLSILQLINVIRIDSMLFAQRSLTFVGFRQLGVCSLILLQCRLKRRIAPMTEGSGPILHERPADSAGSSSCSPKALWILPEPKESGRNRRGIEQPSARLAEPLKLLVRWVSTQSLALGGFATF